MRRISNDDSDDDYDPKKSKENDINEDDLMNEDMLSDEEKPKQIPVTPLAEKFKSFNVNNTARPSANTFNMTSKVEKRQERTQKFKEKNEDRYHWLQNQKDLQGNPIDSPEYDPRTLYIPQSAWNKFTPFEKQYWEVKHKHWDTVGLYYIKNNVLYLNAYCRSFSLKKESFMVSTVSNVIVAMI